MKKLFVPFLLGSLAAACNVASSSDEATVAPSAEGPVDAPTESPKLANGEDAAEAARSFLVGRTDLTRLRDAKEALTLSRSRRDSLGMTHVRFEQKERGVRVVGATVSAHYDATGGLVGVDSHLVPNLETLDLTPGFDAKEAEATALRLYAGRGSAIGNVPRAPELVVFTEGTTAKLAYRVVVQVVDSILGGVTFTIDAKTSALLAAEDHQDDATETAIKTSAKAQSGKTVALDAVKYTDDAGKVSYRLKDKTRTKAADGIITGDLKNTSGPTISFVISTTATNFDPAGVDAHTNAAAVYDFFQSRFGRKGIDGADGRILSVVHADQKLNNAFWNRELKLIAYGDGDGATYGNFAQALDVAAHEFMHGVINTEADLPGDGEGGALNEALADIFGVFVEHSVAPNDVTNWRMGETLVKKGGHLRDLAAGTSLRAGTQQKIPTHASQFIRLKEGAVPEVGNDKGYVHYNLGIVTSAAHLMVMGGTNDVSKITLEKHLDWTKTEKLFYRVVTQYLQPADKIVDLAKHTKTAARDLGFSEEETAVVDCAWIATGVTAGACAPSVLPKAVTAETPEPAPETTTNPAEKTAESDDATAKNNSPSPAAPDFVSGAESNEGGCSQHGKKTSTQEGFVVLFGVAAAIRGLRARRARVLAANDKPHH